MTKSRAMLAVMVPAGAILSWMLVVNAAEVDRTSSGTWDESIYMGLGRQVLRGNAQAFADLGVAPLATRLIWTRSTIEPVDQPETDPRFYRERLSRARQRTAWIIGVPLVLSILIWGSLRHGPVAGIVAAAVVAFSPAIFANVSLATTDAAFALAFVFVVMALIADLERPSWVTASLLSLALGAALATKYSALALWLSTTLLFAWSRHRRWWTSALIAASALIVAWGGHWWAVGPAQISEGLLHGVPVPLIWRGIRAQQYIIAATGPPFLFGDQSPHNPLWLVSAPLLAKSTPVELIAMVSCLGIVIRRFTRDIEVRVLAVCGATLLVAAIATGRGVPSRYLLSLTIVAVVTCVFWLARYRHNTRFAVAGAAAAVVAQSISFFTITAQPLTYFNSLVGGPEAGYTRLVDSDLDWGQDLLRLKDWIDAERIGRVHLLYFGTAPLAAYGIRASKWREFAAPGATGDAGMFVISVSWLQPGSACGDRFAPLRALQPSARVGYTFMAYRLDRPDVVAALDRIARDPCAPD
jgi:hypothetical protein